MKSISVETLESMVDRATQFPADGAGPVISGGNGIHVLRPHTEPFEGSERPLVVMEFLRLMDLLEEAAGQPGRGN